MPLPVCRRESLPVCWTAAALLGLAACGARPLPAQDAATAPASVPAGILSPLADTAPHTALDPVSARHARDADDTYLVGAKAMQRGDLITAEEAFARAARLDPSRPEYALSLTIAREHLISDLVGRAATARRAGNAALANDLLNQARIMDPSSPVVAQHFGPSAVAQPGIVFPAYLPGSGRSPQLGSALELKPSTELHSFHQAASAEEMLRTVYGAYGIKVQFPFAVGGNRTVRLDLDDVDYAAASRIIDKMVNVFAVPVQADGALVVTNTQESRDQYEPLLQETLYMPGLSGEAISELANVARQVFDLKQVTASQTAGDMLVRGNAGTLKLLNAVYADMLDGSSDVQIDIALYEVAKNRTRNLGVQVPGSAGAYSFYTEAQTLISQNQTVIQAAVSSGLITLNGNLAHDLPLELGVLQAAGLLNISQITGLLGTIGSFNGVPLAGVFLGSTTTINFLFNSTEVRTLDFAQLRATNRQPASFRAGTRYPVITGTYSSGITSSALSGLTAAQQQLAQQYLGSSTSVSIPQFQYEDLGLTIKATPTVRTGQDVTLDLDMKIEALGGTSLNNIPILNSRALKSIITVPAGQTAVLASEVTRSELRALTGLPGLNDLPGFQGTDRDNEKDTSELLITLTPHIVRVGRRDSASKRLAFTQSADSTATP